MNNIYLVILLMGLVTYLPRMLPLVALKDRSPSGFAGRVLEYIPAAALSALIFPGSLTATGSVAGAVAAIVVAAFLALRKCSLILVVLGSVAAAVITGLLF